ncbi:hypothetical protein D3C81_821300 [compost metagenome]
MKVSDPVGIGDAAAVGRHALDGGLHALVRGGVGFVHAHGGGLERPVVVEAVLKVQVVGGHVGFGTVPAGTGEGRAGQIDWLTAGIAGDATQQRSRLLAVVADAATHGGGIAQVNVQRAIQRVRLAPLVVDETVALILVGNDPAAHPTVGGQRAASVQLQAIVVPGAGLAGDGDGWGGLATLAHQVDRAAGAAGALQQARGAAQYLDTVEEHQVLGRPVTQRVVVARDRHAVVLPVVDLEAARSHHHAWPDALRADDPGGVVERVLQVCDALVVQLFTGNHRHRLRDFLEAVRAFAKGYRAGCV